MGILDSIKNFFRLKKVEGFIKKDVQKHCRSWNFKYEIKKGKLHVTTSDLDMKGNGDVMVIVDVYSGGGAAFRAVFDKLDKNDRNLEAINEFNRNKSFFGAYIRDDGYLELQNFVVSYGDNLFKEYTSEFLTRLVKLRDDEYLTNLTKYTY